MANARYERAPGSLRAPPGRGPQRISSRAFYATYHGHAVDHLSRLHAEARDGARPSDGRPHCDAIVWLAGDSSLDNKFWFADAAPAVGPYAEVLRPPESVCDVAYWIGRHAEAREGGGPRYACVNAAVEATTLNQRRGGCSLTAQDRFLRDTIREEDVLVVSVGGNDVALCPTPCTALSMGCLLCLPASAVRDGCTCCAVPADDCCCGCGASTLSCLGSWPPCLGYFRHLFGTRVQLYIEAITAVTKPRKVLVCMIYYLDEAPVPSWAGGFLQLIGYNSTPGKLQNIIAKMFEEATRKIRIPGTQVIPVPLFHVLDGATSSDYVSRVEPSAQGGDKMGRYLLDIITKGEGPTNMVMGDR